MHLPHASMAHASFGPGLFGVANLQCDWVYSDETWLDLEFAFSRVLKSDLPQHWSALKVRAWKALAAEISRESLRKSYLAILLSCLVFLSLTCDKETGLTDFQFKPASVIFSISALPRDSTRTKRVATSHE